MTFISSLRNSRLRWRWALILSESLHWIQEFASEALNRKDLCANTKTKKGLDWLVRFCWFVGLVGFGFGTGRAWCLVTLVCWLVLMRTGDRIEGCFFPLPVASLFLSFLLLGFDEGTTKLNYRQFGNVACSTWTEPLHWLEVSRTSTRNKERKNTPWAMLSTVNKPFADHITKRCRQHTHTHQSNTKLFEQTDLKRAFKTKKAKTIGHNEQITWPGKHQGRLLINCWEVVMSEGTRSLWRGDSAEAKGERDGSISCVCP